MVPLNFSFLFRMYSLIIKMTLRCQKNKFWLENVTNLICSLSVIPLTGMSLAEQMNALTRLVLGIFTILLLLGFRFSLLFLLLAILFIIILYYIQRNQMEKFRAEHYERLCETEKATTSST